MDYFQGVVLEYLRADRACFVNPEFWLRGNPEKPHEKPHWFVDAVALHMKDKVVYLCEVTYAKQPRALIQRLQSWKLNWETIEQTLRADAHVDQSWPLIPWVFGATETLTAVKPTLEKLFHKRKMTDLEDVLPWKYCTYDRKEELRTMEEDREEPIVSVPPSS
jgi:hypothetical protein